jgi:hypothetical protein
MSAHRYNRSGQVSVCNVVTVLFELDVNVGHLAQIHVQIGKICFRDTVGPAARSW